MATNPPRDLSEELSGRRMMQTGARMLEDRDETTGYQIMQTATRMMGGQTDDDIPFDATVRDQLDQNGGLPMDSPLLAYSDMQNDKVRQMVAGLEEEAHNETVRIQGRREQEVYAQLLHENPTVSKSELRQSAATIAANESPIDYIGVVHPEWDNHNTGKVHNPGETQSWADDVKASSWGQWLKGIGSAVAGGALDFAKGIDQAFTPENASRVILGGLSDLGKATLGTVGDVIEATTLSAEQKQQVGLNVPDEPQGPPEANIAQQAAQMVPGVATPADASSGEKIARQLVQFASFFFPASAGLKAVGVSAKLSGPAASLLSAVANTNPSDETLSTMVSKLAPGLEQTPIFGTILGFLKSKPDDSEWLRRLKFGIEDVVIGAATEIGLSPRATIQSVTNTLDAVRQAKGGKIATDIIADDAGALWFGAEKAAAKEVPESEARIIAQSELGQPEARPGAAPGAVSVEAPPAPGAAADLEVPTPQRFPQRQPGDVPSPEIPTPGRFPEREPRDLTTPQTPGEPALEAPRETAGAPQAPQAPQAPAAPEAPTAPQAPQAPAAPQAPQAPLKHETFERSPAGSNLTLDEKTKQFAKDFNAEWELYKHGDVRHVHDVALEAKNLGLSVEDIKGIAPGEAQEDTMIAALGQIRYDAAANVDRLARHYLEVRTPEAGERVLQGMADFKVAATRFMTAERAAGRALHMLQEAQVTGNNFIRNIEKAAAEGEAGGSIDLMAQMIASFKEPSQVVQFLNTLGKHVMDNPVMSTLIEAYVNARLSKPVTFVKNVIGNVSFLEQQVLERQVAGLMDMAVQLLPGRHEQGVALSEAREMIHGQWVAKVDALKALGQGLADENPFQSSLGSGVTYASKAERPRAIQAGTYGLDPQGALGRAIDFSGRMIRIPSRINNAADAASRVMARSAEKHALAIRKAREVSRFVRESGGTREEAAKRAGEAYETVISNTPEHIQKAVDKFAGMTTFSDQGGKFQQAISNLVTQVPLLRFPLTFVNAPGRINAQALQRVPFLGLGMRDAREILKNGSLADKEILAARQAVGFAAAGVIWYLASNARITPEAPRNPVLRLAQYRNPAKARSVGFGTGADGKPSLWLPYNWLEPIGTTIGFMADIVAATPHIVKQAAKGNTSLLQQTTDVVENIGQAFVNTLSKSSLSGINDIIDVMMDPTGNKLGRMAANIAGGFIPNVVQGIDQSMNPEYRQAQTGVERLKRQIPMYNATMKVDRDPVTGLHTMKDHLFHVEDASGPLDAALTLLMDISNPVVPGFPGEDPGTELIYENIQRDQLTGINLRVDESLYKHKLEDDELDRLEVLRTHMRIDDSGQLSDSGKTLRDRLYTEMTGERYKNSTPGPEGGKEYLVRKIFKTYDDAANIQLLQEFPHLAADITMERLNGAIQRVPGVLTPEGQQQAEQVRQEVSKRMLIAR